MEKSNSNKILIRGVNWLGDAVLTFPAIKAIAVSFPEYSIDVLTRQNLKGLYELCPRIENVFSIEKEKGLNKFIGEIKKSGEIKEKKYEMAFIFPSSFHSTLIPFAAGIPVRIGYKKNTRSYLLTHAYPIKGDYKSDIHQSHFYLNLVQYFTKKFFATDADFLKIPEGLKADVFKKLEDNGYLGGHIIGIAPGAEYGPAKRWPVSHWYELISQVLKETDHPVVITGSCEDTKAADFLKENSQGRVVDMTGKTTLQEFLAILSLCSVFVANDSGAMHAASAIGTPVVGIFGSTCPTATSPVMGRNKIIYKGLTCSPCFERECPKKNYECLSSIEPEEVFEALKEFL